ncbi:hypothetical protein [Streptomyces sp. 900105245]
MIVFYGAKDDYAVTKHVQQLQVAFPDMRVAEFSEMVDLSEIALNERLYLVAHGNPRNGDLLVYQDPNNPQDLRDMTREQLLEWLTRRNLPKKFAGGIAILSCYGGLQRGQRYPASLASYIADGLAGHVAADTLVTGAKGYTYGTPEYQLSGFCSVLPISLDSLYSPHSDPDTKVRQWLSHTPTHKNGILSDVLDTVATNKTISQQLQETGKTEEESSGTARKLVLDFTFEAQGIEEKLKDLIKDEITEGNTVIDRVNYMLNNRKDKSVTAWNRAIVNQYILYHNYYLWAPEVAAFAVFAVK